MKISDDLNSVIPRDGRDIAVDEALYLQDLA